MNKMIIKNNCELTQSELSNIESLSNECFAYDQVSPKIYWDNIKIKREIHANYLCYFGEKLIGYLSYFLFQDDAVHISAMVHPQYRKQGIFTQMLSLAKPNIIRQHYTQAIIPLNRDNVHTQSFAQHLKAVFLFSEYHMVREIREPEEVSLGELKIVNSDQSHLELMARIDHMCFASDYQIMLERYQFLMNKVNRKVLLLQFRDQIIGKCHIRFDAKEVYLHDICILPAYRRKGYGRVLLKSTINQIISNHQQCPIVLDVETDNEAALKLYQDCHFSVRCVEEYWKIAL